MPVFRESSILVVSPGSQTTLAQYGLGESLGPATYEVPSRVFKTADGGFASSGNDDDAVYPVVRGRIVDLAAFNYLLKLVYKSATAGSVIPPAMLLVSDPRWTHTQIEHITQYAFESTQVPGFAIVPGAQAAAYAHAVQDALVIDIGYEKTEVSPILEFSVLEHAQATVDVGGALINEEIARLLPDLTAEQVEDLKLSPIYEALNADDTKNSWFGLNDQGNEIAEEDGVVDVAAIVASGRTREILAEREKAKQAGEDQKVEPPNMDREFNTFIDSKGRNIEVGKQRFHGTEKLIDAIVETVGKVMSKIDQVNRRQDVWDNVIVLGRGSGVRGLREAIFVQLQARYVISRPTTYSELPSTFNTGHNTPNGTPMYNNGVNPMAQLHQGHGQSPTSIRLAKMAEYFPEWKGRGWENAGFLGAEMAAKQIFTTSNDNNFVSRNDYNEMGPTCIWDI